MGGSPDGAVEPDRQHQETLDLGTEMVHGRAGAPPRQTWRVAVNEGS